MSDKHRRLTASIEMGQNQVGIVNLELQPMVIRVTDEDGKPAPLLRVDVHRRDEGQGHFELVDQMTDQHGIAAALYVPAELTTRYEIEFRVINGDDSSTTAVFTGCVCDPVLGTAVELPTTVGLRRNGRTIHPRADVPQLNPMIAPAVDHQSAQYAALNDRWFSNDAARPAPPAEPSVPIISAVLAAPVVPVTVARTPPRPRPAPEVMTAAKTATARQYRTPVDDEAEAPPPRRRRELPLRYLIAAAVVMWVLVGAGFLVMVVSKPVSLKSGRTTVSLPDNAAETAQTYALGDTAPDGR